MSEQKDKFRIYFYWESKLYEKYIDIDYPKNLLDNSEHKQSYIFKEIVPIGMKELHRWYKEVTGQEYPNIETPLREITYNNPDLSVEEVIKMADINIDK